MKESRDAVGTDLRHLARTRVFVFPDWPRTILIHFDDGSGMARVPELPLPLDRAATRDAFRAAGVEATVTESVPGRWTSAMRKAASDERAERGQRVRLATAAALALARQSPEPAVRDHAELVQRKLAVDQEGRELKAKIAAAASNARVCGEYMNAGEFRSMERRLEEIRQESQALQTQIGEARDREKKARAREHDERQAFIEAAKRILDPETYERIWYEARADDGADDD